MRFEERVVTPELANAWLETMGENRPIRPFRVEQLKEDMLRGAFTNSPQPICFDSNGVLIDGQHRLSAIVKSGVSVPMAIAYDVDHEAVIDRGAPRSSGDSLYMRGLLPIELSKTTPIAIANCYLREVKPSAGRRITDADRYNFLNKHGEEVLSAINISSAGITSGICRKAAVQTAIFAAIQSGVSKEKLTRFAHCVNTGFIDSPSEAASIVLRNRLLEMKLGGHAAEHDLVMSSEMAIKDFASGISRQRRYITLKHIYIHPEFDGRDGK